MTKRRGKGEGSIYRRKDGRWVASIDLGWRDGKRKRKEVSGKTRRIVAQKLRDLQRRQADGLPISTDRQTVDDLLTYWLDHEVRRTRSRKTYESYEGLVRLHLVPGLGRLPLAKLEPQHVQAFLNRKLEDGLSPRTVSYLLTVLRMSLRRAERWGAVPRNVAQLVDPPKKVTKEIRALDPGEALNFLEAVKGDRWEAMWTLALTLGLRKGEVLGLHWGDIDMEKRTVAIRKSLQRVDGDLRRVEPKTARSVRTLPLPETAIDSLQRQRAKQLEERLLAGPLWADGDFVTATKMGTPVDERNVTRRLHRILRDAQLPKVTFHGLRHSCASLLVAQGVHPRVVMETLGHSRVSVTMEIYSHVTAGSQRQAADEMDRLFRGA